MKPRQMTALCLCLISVLLLLAACGTPKDESADDTVPMPDSAIAGTAEPEPILTDTDIPAPDIGDISAVSELERMGTIRIALYYNDAAFKKALEIFKGKYPGWEVEIIPLAEEVEVRGTDGNVYTQFENKYVDTMAMLNRNEVDVVNTLWWNTGSFIHTDKLEDLTVMFQDDLDVNLNRLLPGISGLLMTSDGKLPLLPVSFGSNVLFPMDGITIHQSDEIPKQWTWYEMLDWFEDDFKANGVKYLLYQSAYNFMDNSLLLEYMNYIYNDFTKEADFNSPILEGIAMLTKNLLDNERLVGIHWKDLYPEHGLIFWDDNPTDFMFMYTSLGENVVDYSTLMTSYGQAYPRPHIEGTEGKSVRLHNNYGINADSSASTKRAAWELIKILISDEIQNSGLLIDCAVVSELTREGVARNLYGYQFNEATDERKQEMINSVTQEALDKFNSDRLTYYQDINQLDYRTEFGLEHVIFDSSIPYFYGEATFEECIANMVSAYPQVKAERQAENARASQSVSSPVADSKLRELQAKQDD
jgi:ABC-type glycerol-3-phosphate transport system substrate-binding protein